MSKTVKLLLFVLVLFVLYGIYFHTKSKADYQDKINIVEKEKVKLKSIIAKGIAQVQKIRNEKEYLISKYHFDLQDTAETIQGLQDKLKKKLKVEIRYKDRIITVEAPRSELWDFSLNIHTDFQEYVRLDKIEQKKADKIIKDLKELNNKSESQTQIAKNIANGWTLSYGGQVGFGTNGFYAGVGISYSKRLKKIK